jgi:hypothetical protein
MKKGSTIYVALPDPMRVCEGTLGEDVDWFFRWHPVPVCIRDGDKIRRLKILPGRVHLDRIRAAGALAGDLRVEVREVQQALNRARRRLKAAEKLRSKELDAWEAAQKASDGARAH